MLCEENAKNLVFEDMLRDLGDWSKIMGIIYYLGKFFRHRKGWWKSRKNLLRRRSARRGSYARSWNLRRQIGLVEILFTVSLCSDAKS